MSFSRFFIDRPVLAIVISIVTVIAGLIAMFSLPIAQYPEIVPPTVNVTCTFPGADAQTVADTVGAPIEQQVNGVEGMLYMSSQSGNDGSYRLTVTFKLGVNLDIAQVQVQNRVAVAQPVLPSDVQRLGITVRKASPDITLAAQFFSPDNSRDTLYVSNYVNLQVRDQIARLPGVGDTNVFGQREYSMRLWLDPDQLAYRNMTAADVVAAVREQNVQVAAGVVGQPPLANPTAFQLTVNAQGRLIDPQQFDRIVVKTGADGAIVRLKDVGRVELGALDYQVSTYLNGKPAVALAVFQLPGTNAIDTADAVYARLAELKKTFPPGIDYAIPYDTTVFVRESIRDVVKTLFEAILLVVIVVLVFLQSWRASVIPLLAIPVSLIGTFAVMKVLGFSLNNLSLFGIVLAIGIVVDDAIVVVENVDRWIEQGFPARDASHRAMDEVTGAVIAIAFGLSAIFIPTAFITGITGQFYRQFALTISASTLLSAFNSLTLSPALAALLLESHHARPDPFQRVIDFTVGWFFKGFNWTLDRATHVYAGVVRRALRVAAAVLLVYAGLLYLTYLGFRAVPTGFIPQQDTGYAIANLQLPDAASIYRTNDVILRMAKIANDMPGVANTFAITGFNALTGINQSNTGAIFVVFNPFERRTREKDQTAPVLIAKLNKAYSQIQEGFALVFPPPPVRGLSNAGGFRMMVQDRSGRHSPIELQNATEAVIAAARQDPRLTNLLTSFRATVPQLYVNVDREKAKTQNVPVTNIFDTLQTYLGSLYVNDFNFLGRTFRVTAQAEAKYRATASDVARLQTRNAAGGMVPLGSVLNVKETVGPSRIQRYNLYRAAEINGATQPGVSSGTMIQLMQAAADRTLPEDMGTEWTELTYQQMLAGNTSIYVFPLCCLFVWLTHAAEYESFPLSTAIILIIPMCLLAGIAGVYFRHMENNIFTQIGFVVLAGLSAKNAVLIVEFAHQQEHIHGLAPAQAATEAARLRLRPILMTSFAFILGVLPLVTANGAGAEMRNYLGTAVFFGMLGVTFFGLILTPVFYLSIRWATNKIAGRPGNAPTPHATPVEPREQNKLPDSTPPRT